MQLKDYVPEGGTALLDTIGKTINHIDKIHKSMEPKKVPAHTIFFIMTDGFENASSKYNYDQIKRKIKSHEKNKKWQFVFMAANMDAVKEASHIGISKDHAINFEMNGESIEELHCYSCCMAMDYFFKETGEN